MVASGKLRRLPSSEHVRCVVLEQGGSVIHEVKDDLDQTVVVAQQPSETALGFAERVLERVAHLERGGRHFSAATVCTGAPVGPEALAARRLIVRGLAAHARAHGLSELLLTAPPNAGPQRRAELLDLVQEVWGVAAGIPVRVSFSAPEPREPKSGVFACPRRPELAHGEPGGSKRSSVSSSSATLTGLVK